MIQSDSGVNTNPDTQLENTQSPPAKTSQQLLQQIQQMDQHTFEIDGCTVHLDGISKLAVSLGLYPKHLMRQVRFLYAYKTLYALLAGLVTFLLTAAIGRVVAGVLGAFAAYVTYILVQSMIYIKQRAVETRYKAQVTERIQKALEPLMEGLRSRRLRGHLLYVGQDWPFLNTHMPPLRILLEAETDDQRPYAFAVTGDFGNVEPLLTGLFGHARRIDYWPSKGRK